MKKTRNLISGFFLAIVIVLSGVVGINGASVEGDAVELGTIRAWAVADSLTSERLFEDF